jgi:hypothetical protein
VVSIGLEESTVASQLRTVRPHEHRKRKSPKAFKRNSTVGYELDLGVVHTFAENVGSGPRQTGRHETC